MNINKQALITTAICLAGLIVSGCGGEKKPNAKANEPTTYDATGFLAKAEIPGSKDVIAVRKDSKDGDDIVVVGRIGGSIDPWVEGRAAFSIVDRSLKACSDDKEDGEPCSCKTPWDYCCETDKLKDAMILVKFVESDGKVVKHDARKIFGIEELETVFVEGKAKRDESGNLTVLASKFYSKPNK